MSEVGVTQLRQDLKNWVARAQAGDEVIVTDRGEPVARLTGIQVPPVFEQLVAEGKVSRPGRSRPRARGLDRVHGRGPVSEYLIDERDVRRR